MAPNLSPPVSVFVSFSLSTAIEGGLSSLNSLVRSAPGLFPFPLPSVRLGLFGVHWATRTTERSLRDFLSVWLYKNFLV